MTMMISPIEPLALGFVLFAEWPFGAQLATKASNRTPEINDANSFMNEEVSFPGQIKYLKILNLF
jgi:hypothetical protein